MAIAALVALAWYVVKKDKDSRERDKEFSETITALMDAHAAENKETQAALNNINIALTRLCERLGEK